MLADAADDTITPPPGGVSPELHCTFDDSDEDDDDDGDDQSYGVVY